MADPTDNTPEAWRRLLAPPRAPNLPSFGFFLHSPAGVGQLRRFNEGLATLESVTQEASGIVELIVCEPEAPPPPPPPPDPIYGLVTSKTYPVEVIEEMNFAQAEILRADFLFWPIEPLDILQAELLAAELREPIVDYSIPPEAMDIAQAELLAAEMRDPLKSYDIPFESMDIAQAELLDAAMRDALIRYTNWPAESMDIAQAELLGATLT